ncbi:hypothetical protein M413DRAFT_305023 [Hebeloma cylindrosporum]|uniref:PUB domain-containing protein n=1 Tax=Hebeloma cylindrosporum TaxID=76867 RepID=A0A0C2YYV5_HEBCY|nr:hypothetical protein M413DRAFT_305023 [Hebeloma cylindrosporum h7]
MSSPTPPISPEALAAAAERRTRQTTPQLTASQLAAQHDKRQRFRRLIDPGITRPNPKDRAMSSLKTLLTIAENLIREPENPKFQQFKPTNNVIKRDLVDSKGALEFAIELGFRPEVNNFQPYYTFHRKHMEDLQMGAGILKEYITLETEKQERAARAKKSEKAAHDAAAERVKLAFIDDRKTKEQRDEIEREQRAARAVQAALAAAAAASTSPSPRARSSTPDSDPEAENSRMPGSGHVLGPPTTNREEPPTYEHALETTC